VFVTSELHDESPEELGIFHAAGKLRDSLSLSLSHQEDVFLPEIRDWFDSNLRKPKRFTSPSLPTTQKRQNGISWFKDSAREQIRRMREMVALLEHHDVPIRMIKTLRPG